MKITMKQAVTMSVAGAVAVGGGAYLAASRIYGGKPATLPHHNAVISLHRRGDPNIFCSGTLISKDLVLTAAHCLVGAVASNIQVYIGDNPVKDLNPNFLNVAEVAINPNYDEIALLHDIAIVKLKVQTGLAEPVPPLPKALGLIAGETANFAGFGRTEAGTYDQKLQVSGTVNIQSPVLMRYEQSWGGPCFGDSGGPAFVQRGGKWYVAGITSYGDGECTAYGVSTRADAYEAWLAPFLPPPPPPTLPPTVPVPQAPEPTKCSL